MPVGRPATHRVAIFHDGEAVGIRQSKILIGKLREDQPRTRQATPVELLDRQRGQRTDKGQKLRGSHPVIPAQEPTVALGHYQSRSDQRRRRGEQPLRSVPRSIPVDSFDPELLLPLRYHPNVRDNLLECFAAFS
jgi:hypothetical protein